MGEAARTLEWRPSQSPDNAPKFHSSVILLQQLAHSGLLGASTCAAGTSQAYAFYKLEMFIDGFLEANKRFAGTETLTTIDLGITEQAKRILRRRGRDKAASYAEFIGHDRELSWDLLAARQQISFCIHAAIVWHTAWHLLAAGVSVRRVIRLLKAAQSDSVPEEKRSRVQMDRIVAASERMATASGPIVERIGTQARSFLRIAAYKIRVARERHAMAASAQRAATAARLAEAEAARLATLEAERQRASTGISSAIGDTITLDGSQLRRSVVGTWFKLVGLSWVSLIWGALLSAPFGVGLGIFATMFAGMFVVPAWGTLWGFLGMRAARDGTLRQMGFAPLGADQPLHETCARFAQQLGIPCPQLGTIDAHNAFAMGVDQNNATVALGRPLLRQLSEAEIEAVLAHELGHVVSGDMRRMMLMRTFQNACVWYGMAQGLKQLARWTICWAAELSILAFSRKREYYADAIGAALAGKEAMIGALRVLKDGPELTSEENTHARFMFRGRVKSALSTHPSFEDRITALEQETYLRELPVRRL